MLLALVFLVIPDLVEKPVVSNSGTTTRESPPTGAPSGGEDEQLPPFEALLREQTREKAQEELSRFVELQMQLEKTMQVGEWGQVAFDEAKSLATQGDEQFVAEAFEASLDAYRAAGDALAELIATGEALLEKALTQGESALKVRDQTLAMEEFHRALTIDPNNSQAQNGVDRSDLLPQVIDLLREAKNH